MKTNEEIEQLKYGKTSMELYMEAQQKVSERVILKIEMENTLENKIKYLSQYIGCNVYFRDILAKLIGVNYNKAIIVYDGYAHEYRPYNIKLELQPLSSITDEDAIEVAYIVYPKNRGNFVDTDFVRGLIEIWSSRRDVSDYLRSKDYALAFQDLQVDDLIAYGWLKLK